MDYTNFDRDETIKKWITALRSKKYIQGYSKLKSKNNRFCCLGVLCDIIDPKAWSEESNFFRWNNKVFAGAPYNLREILNISYDQEDALIEMNDFSGKNFCEIADYIAENIL